MKKYKWHDTIVIPFRCAPVSFVLRIVLLAGMRMLPLLQAFATAAFIDGALQTLRGEAAWRELGVPIFLLALVIACSHLGSVFSNLLNQCIGNGIRLKFVEYLTKKCASLPYPCIENSETWNLIKRVKNKPDETVQKGLENELNIAGIVIQAGSLLAVLFLQIWWSVPVVLFVLIVVMAFALKGGKAQYDAEREMAESVRRYEYMGNVLMGREAAEERSLFQFFPFFEERWKQHYQKARRAERTITVKWLVRMKAASSSMVLITFAVAVSMLYPVAKRTMTAGLYFSLIQVVNELISVMSWELSDSINAYAKYREYIKDVVEFANLEEVPGALCVPEKDAEKIESVEFQNVSFAYADSEKPVLKQVSLKLEAGKHYAIVGKNGAGKTTLVKLLTGLYTDFTGDILLNGTSIRKISSAKLKAMITVLFQDFARYEISVRDNIGLGNIAEFGTKEQEEKIWQAVRLFGLESKIEQLPRKLDTNLGKLETDGQELSGGQWQRVAMARTVLSDAALLILDEPTAALDPMSESSLYEQFGKAGENRTTIFISHRLGSVMLADEIIVLDEGRIVRQGSHETLMKECLLYREMYESQRSWYINEG